RAEAFYFLDPKSPNAFKVGAIQENSNQCKMQEASMKSKFAASRASRLVPTFAILAVLAVLFQSSASGQAKAKKAGAGTQAHEAAHTAQARQAREVKQYTIEQFLNTISIGGSSFSPDEKSILVHSNKSGIYNVYSIPVAGGDMKQQTRSTTESV